MHEFSIARDIIEIVIQEMQNNNLTRVQTVTLQIGEMAQVMPEALCFGFECLCKDTPLDKAKLIIQTVPVKAVCCQCGRDFIVRDWSYDCPECGATDTEIISGKGLQLTEFEGS